MTDLLHAGVEGQAAAIRADDVSATELTDLVLGAIRRLDPMVNAFSEVLADAALEDAAHLDTIPAAKRGPLHGIPIAIKQENDVAGSVTTFGGRSNVTPAAHDSEVVRRLRRAGAVIVGKTTMPEFGLWPLTESETTGITHNPWSLAHSTGGSSGGSAAAVASGMVATAIGGDGGGSIRIPASCCGLFGLKPSRGRVSTAPNPDLWHALGVIGPLTRTVMDSAIVNDVIAGSRPTDRYHAPPLRESLVNAVGREPGRLRIGVSMKPTALGAACDAEIEAATRAVAEAFSALGHEVREVDPKYPDVTIAFVPQVFGGVREEAARVEHYDRLEGRTRTVLRLGTWARPFVTRYAVSESSRVAAKVNTIFDDIDVLLTPTLPRVPPKTPALPGNAIRALFTALPMTAYTAMWNLCGNPAASLPAGFSKSGLPIGVQIVGRPNDEPTLMSLAAQIERADPWVGCWPSL